VGNRHRFQNPSRGSELTERAKGLRRRLPDQDHYIANDFGSISASVCRQQVKTDGQKIVWQGAGFHFTHYAVLTYFGDCAEVIELSPMTVASNSNP
jgi:hypothetical protein